MKKYLLSIASILALAGLVYAAAPATSVDTGTAANGAWVAAAASGKVTFPANTTNGPLIQFTPSANVAMAYDCDDGTVYTFGSYHSAGTKLYGTSSSDAKIYMYDVGTPPGANAPTKVIPQSATPNYSTGWSAIK